MPHVPPTAQLVPWSAHRLQNHRVSWRLVRWHERMSRPVWRGRRRDYQQTNSGCDHSGTKRANHRDHGRRLVLRGRTLPRGNHSRGHINHACDPSASRDRHGGRRPRSSRFHATELQALTEAGLNSDQKRSDALISAVGRYIGAMGGELEIIAKSPEARVKINQFSDLEEHPAAAERG